MTTHISPISASKRQTFQRCSVFHGLLKEMATSSLHRQCWCQSIVNANSSGNTHEALALGLKPLDSYTLRPAVQLGEQVYCGQGEEVRPEALSQLLPENSHQGETKDGFLVTALTTEQMRFVTVVDGLGHSYGPKRSHFKGGSVMMVRSLRP